MPLALPEQLLLALTQLPAARRYWVGFSGGLDSSVLLHCLAALQGRLGAPLAALYIDHGWHPAAASWGDHCGVVAAALGVVYERIAVNATAQGGESPEAAARRARYAAIAGRLQPGEMLLTAHHLDDQAETLLLQLFRGAGPRGLAAMPSAAPLGEGWHGRPLLGVDRQRLAGYAASHQLRWLEDPSNLDITLDRNRLRRQLMPALLERWPSLPRVLARTAGHMAEASQLLDELAAAEAERALGGHPHCLSATAVAALAPPHARNLLRWWIRSRQLPPPDSNRLDQVLREVVGAAPQASPRVAWVGAEVRRYRDDLYALAPLAAVPEGGWEWSLHRPLTLPGLGTLVAERGRGEGLRADIERVTVRFRHGGERCRPVGRDGSHPLKKLWQEAGVAPWEREREPLLLVEGALAAVGERWICQPFAAAAGAPGWRIRWWR